MNISHSARISLFTLLAFSSLTILSSCGDSGTGPGDFTVNKPGIGSTFTVAGYYTNNDGTIVESSRDTAVGTLAKIHPSLKGQADVYEFTSKFGSTFYSYADNGDIYILFQASLNGGGKDSVWIRMPVSSGDEVTQELSSDQQVAGPATIISTMTYTAKRTGAQNATVGSKSLSTQRVDATIVSKTEYIINGVSEQNISIYNNISIDFAPEIGYVTRQSTSITNEENASVGPGSYATLIDYTVK